MGKYTETQSRIFSVFGSIAWTAEGIKTFPSDTVPNNVGNEYIRVAILPSGKGINRFSLSGICIIDIFTAFGDGPNRATVIADILDRHLANKTLSVILGDGHVQFGDSTGLPKGQDKDNPALTRFSYTIPFNYFGNIE